METNTGRGDFLHELKFEDVTKDDLAGIYGEVAEQIGVDNAYILFRYFRGQQRSFPLKFYSSDCIAREMCREYNGKNTREIARKYGYSESRVRQIVHDKKKGKK